MVTIPTQGWEAVHFGLEATNGLIQEHGYIVTWEKSMFCTCVNNDTRQPDPNCSLCSGRGFIYFDAQNIRALITSLSSTKAFREGHIIGDWILGKASMSVEAKSPVSFRDRITHTESFIRYAEHFVFEVGQTEYTLNYPVQSVLRLQYKEQELIEGTNFTVSDGKIVFSDITSFEENNWFSILYMCHPTWIVLDHLHTVRDVRVEDQQGANFQKINAAAPRQMLIELEYLNGVEPVN